MFESLYAVIGIAVIFFLGFFGALTPSILARFFPKYGITRKYYFSFFNGIAAGVILAVGIIHSLSDSQTAFLSISTLDGDSLTDQYPWNLWLMLMAILILFTVEEILEFLASRFGIIGFDAHGAMGSTANSKPQKNQEGHSHGHGHDHEAHACDHTPEEHKSNDGECDAQPLEELCDHHDHSYDQSDDDTNKEIEPAVTVNEEKGSDEPSDVDSDDEGEAPPINGLALVLKMVMVFIGLMLHNVFVGLALGIADNDYVLFIALIFHQFFEGLGMGARVAMANLRHLATVLAIDFFFALIPVIFIGIGVGIKNSISVAPDSTDGYNITKGTLQGLSGGVLVYVAIMHMIRAYKDNGATGWSLEWHRLSSYIGLPFGAAVMSVIGIWA